MKQLLATQEILHPRLFHSLQKALTPLMSMSKTGYNINDLVQLADKKLDLKTHAQKKKSAVQSSEHAVQDGERRSAQCGDAPCNDDSTTVTAVDDVLFFVEDTTS